MTLTSYVSKRSKGYFGQKQRHVQPQLLVHEIRTPAGLVLTQQKSHELSLSLSKLNVHSQLKHERGTRYHID